MKRQTMYLLTTIGSLSSLFFFSAVLAQAATCSSIPSDLYYGITDSNSNGPISQLQNFLVSGGYMSTSPNGHFGPATLAAVESFQSAKNINATGYVGPITRIAIQSLTCSTSANTSQTNETTATTPSAPSNINQIQVTSPSAGETLTIGKSYDIKWTNQPQSNYSIILETPGGVGEGFIASNISGGTNYSWTVGNIFSNGLPVTSVAQGAYRIHIENTTSGISNSDQYSATFNIVPPNLSVNSFFPTSASNSGNFSVALFGSGFDSSTFVYLDTGVQMNKLFVSPDGTIFVFSVPSTVASGSHQMFVSNEYQSNIYVGALNIIQSIQ